MDGARILAADREPGNWMSHGRTYAEERFSPLNDINDGNAARLGLAWYYDLGTLRGIEATPLVIDGVMYTTGAWSIVHAIDAATGTRQWVFDPKVPKAWGRFVCCDVVNRGVAAWNGKIYVGTLDGRLIALDARTGTPVWEVQTTDRDWPYSITGAPRVVNGKVIIGNAGADFGVRGYVTAYDAETGKQHWRFYTVPGNPADGFENAAMEMAAKTWTGEWWKSGGGGTAWDSFAFDPELNLLYIGTGNGSPWAHKFRSPGGGDNLFLSSILALDADTGEYRWHYQTTPGETWDFTATQQMILADLEIAGAERKVLMQAPKNGFFYVLDRATGELLSAAKIANISWATHVDPESGRPVETPGARYESGTMPVSPSPGGAHNWVPMAFNPMTGLVYIPVMEGAYPYGLARDYEFRKWVWNTAQSPENFLPPKDAPPPEPRAPHPARLSAWDPVAQREVWQAPQSGEWNGGALTTAGNLVFQGMMSQQFAAWRADTGEKLWEMPVQTGVLGGPIAYTAGGEEFIAVSAGWGGGYPITAGTASRPEKPRAPGRVLAFKLGGTAELPPLPAEDVLPEPPAQTASAETLSRGERLYNTYCFMCHGLGAVGGRVIRDLRYMNAATHERFYAIVLEGIYGDLGMAGFGDVLNAEEADAIHAYVVSRAQAAWRAEHSRNE
ncbi:MAG TPA: PQQ-dependent dehydrogenase, methanol/ethanol family [Gammaproteobacteria bacterium]